MVLNFFIKLKGGPLVLSNVHHVITKVKHDIIKPKVLLVYVLFPGLTLVHESLSIP